MDDGDQGYRIDGTLHPWGTLFAEPAERPCATAYGFETIYVELSAADTGRPVITASYELANVVSPKDVLARLVKQLGQATDIDRSDEESGAGSPDTVVIYANWDRGNHSIALSLYGAPRASNFGDGIGKLYLSWNEADAAGPFMAEWQAACDALAAAAEAPEGQPAIFTVAWPIFEPESEPQSANSHTLNMPELLETPKVVADRLGTQSFALWQGGGAWHLSNGRDTIMLGRPGSTEVHIHDISPAKGGGYAALEVGPWSVRDEQHSPAIAEAAALLEHLPGLTIERHDGYNV